jgi:hypothetical protein
LHVSPEQQLVSAVPVHCAPNGVHEVALPPPHFRIMLSVGSGAHASLLQHWSLNWQTAPGSMQHWGFAPSYPVGQVVEAPPKQRGMPFESSLQTAFLPLQQSCEALAPVAPQMLPGGLHAVPLLHVEELQVTL